MIHLLLLRARDAGRRTLESVSAADALVDALEMAAHEEERRREHQQQLAAGVRGSSRHRGGTEGGGTGTASACGPTFVLRLQPPVCARCCAVPGLRGARLHGAWLHGAWLRGAWAAWCLAAWCLGCMVPGLHGAWLHGAWAALCLGCLRPTWRACHQHTVLHGVGMGVGLEVWGAHGRACVHEQLILLA